MKWVAQRYYQIRYYIERILCLYWRVRWQWMCLEVLQLRRRKIRMTQHFTRSTVSASFFCGKCGRMTMHRIDGGRKGPCLECIARLDAEHAAKPAAPAEVQQDLFKK